MRYFFISILTHILVISSFWVGLSVPVGRDQNSFTYLGTLLSPEQTKSDALQRQQVKGFEAVGFEESESAFFTPWLKMRQMDKPR
ncbi:MAG: hypothetical protein HY209_06320 [Candidatus Omnitrophica bacterium]|nr:hypothetical protein [Candidatus Omnitrophota bacterium]